jgi:hypothetical protein
MEFEDSLKVGGDGRLIFEAPNVFLRIPTVREPLSGVPRNNWDYKNI